MNTNTSVPLRAAANEQAQQLDLIPLAEVPRILPPRAGGKRIHPSCVFRWASHGILGCRLRWISMGRCRVTRREWLEEFFSRVAAARDDIRGDVAKIGKERCSQKPGSSPSGERTARTELALRRHGLVTTSHAGREKASNGRKRKTRSVGSYTARSSQGDRP